MKPSFGNPSGSGEEIIWKPHPSSSVHKAMKRKKMLNMTIEADEEVLGGQQRRLPGTTGATQLLQDSSRHWYTDICKS
jgi:hypothetical protein